MNSDNPYAAPAIEIASPRAKQAPTKSLKQAIWRGAKAGLKWTTYVIGPVAILCQIAFVAFLVFGLVTPDWDEVIADHPLLILRFLISPFAFYLACCVYGVIIAVAAKVIDYAVRRIRKRRARIDAPEA